MRSKKELKRARFRHNLRAWWFFIANNYERYGIEINEVIKIDDELEEIGA